MTPDDKSTSPRSRGLGPHGAAPDEFSVFMPERPKRPGLGARHILFAGVAGACVLGVGLGLWARPAMSERQASAATPADAPKAAAPSVRKLEIVVDDRPAPVGAPIDVLPASSPERPRILPPAPRAAPEPQAPSPSPTAQGLMRVRDVFFRESAPTPAEPAAAPKPASRPTLTPLLAALLAPKPAVVAAKPVAPEPVRVAQARSAPAHTGPAHRAPVQVAAVRAEPAHTAPAHPAPVRLAKAAPAAKPAAQPSHKVELARAAAGKAAAHRLELAEAAKAAKAARRQQLQLAQAEARGRAEARAEAKAEALALAREDARKRARLASLAHAFQRLLPHQAKPAPVVMAKAERKAAHRSRHEAQVERASLRTHRAPRMAEPAPRARSTPPPPSHASGLMKVSAPRCANRDPGQALVCADPSLGAADRQLSRAYQDARAAGVPDAQLQHQQQRWLAARSAAAREAPWAVHDVYLARIAELNGLAREAHGDGY